MWPVRANPGALSAFLTLLIVHGAGAGALTTIWRQLSDQRVTTYEALTSEKSIIDCVRQCGSYSPYCVVVAYDEPTKMCYLLPDTVNSTSEESASSRKATLYRNKYDVCALSTAPAFPHGDVTVYDRTLRSLTAEVACHGDYIASVEEDVHLRCLSTGCGRVLGSVVRGFGDRALMFINLVHDNQTLPLHISVRFDHASDIDTVVLNSQVQGVWGSEFKLKAPSHPFPFTVGQQFVMNITAISLNDLRVYVNGSEFFTWTTPTGISVNMIHFIDDIEVHYMNLACTP